MEVIIVASAVSQLALRFLDRYCDSIGKKGHRRAPTDVTTKVPPNYADERLTTHESNDQPKEGSIASLELRLKNLRAQAKDLNSPDTFVQYARVTREANMVEKELIQKREQEGIHESSLDIENITRLFSNAVGPSTISTMHRKVRAFAMKFVLRVVIFSTLWFYFAWNRHDGDGSVMVVDCRAVRPLGFLLTKRMPFCSESDWVCSSSPPECRIPFTLAFGMCNVVVAMIVKAFK